MRKTYITSMPDKAGAFLTAGEIIAKNGANIARVSYNKAVDMHTLFIDVDGDETQLKQITKELLAAGYLTHNAEQAKVMLVEFKINDVPGGILPILKVLNNYRVNISYMNSQENGTEIQNFKMGLLITNVSDTKNMLDEISRLCDIKILDYEGSEKLLDNTVFYYTFANEIKEKLSLTHRQMSQLVADSNRIMQMLDDKNETPYKTFDFIKKFTDFMVKYKGDSFNAIVSKHQISDAVTMYLIQPPCGSNTYILQGKDELMFIDTGFACYKDEMYKIFYSLFPCFDSLKKKVYITHSDMDHCGLLNCFDEIYLNKKSAESFELERGGKDNFREQNKFNAAYSRIGRLISRYTTPDESKLRIYDMWQADENEKISKISQFTFEDLTFEVYQGNGGHIHGEVVFVCEQQAIIFTGDNVVNIGGFSKEQAEFNVLAPYLMKSVNINSKKATEIRGIIFDMIRKIEEQTQKQCLICGGHGAISLLVGGKLVTVRTV